MTWIIGYAIVALALLAVFIRNEYADSDTPGSTKIGQCILCAGFWPLTVPIGVAMVVGERLGRAARKRAALKSSPTGEQG